MLGQILVALGILFLLLIILAPIYYYFQREKYADNEAEAEEDHTEEDNVEEQG